MISEKIAVEHVQIGIQASNWEEAIRASSQTLLKSGSIEESYIEAMITSLKVNGPYIVLGKHVALAHTRPECGVNHMALAFSTLHPGVDFGAADFDPIRLIITLAATDSETHLEILAELVDILMDEERMEVLFRASTSEEFCKELTR